MQTKNPSIYFGGFQLTRKIIQYLIMVWFTKRKNIDLSLVLFEYEQISKEDFSNFSSMFLNPNIFFQFEFLILLIY